MRKCGVGNSRFQIPDSKWQIGRSVFQLEMAEGTGIQSSRRDLAHLLVAASALKRRVIFVGSLRDLWVGEM